MFYPIAILLLALVLVDELKADIEFTAKTVDDLPVHFIDEEQLNEVDDWRNPSLHNTSDLFLKQKFFDQYRYVNRAFLPSNHAWIGAKKGESLNDFALLAPPFSLMVGVPWQAGDFSQGFAGLGRCEIGEGLDVSNRMNLGDFELINLFGCSTNERLYQFLSTIDFHGCLVLPFTGVDLTANEGFPKSVKKLVIYNSHLDEAFVKCLLFEI